MSIMLFFTLNCCNSAICIRLKLHDTTQKYIKRIFIENKINEIAGFINEITIFINEWMSC